MEEEINVSYERSKRLTNWIFSMIFCVVFILSCIPCILFLVRDVSKYAFPIYILIVIVYEWVTYFGKCKVLNSVAVRRAYIGLGVLIIVPFVAELFMYIFDNNIVNYDIFPKNTFNIYDICYTVSYILIFITVDYVQTKIIPEFFKQYKNVKIFFLCSVLIWLYVSFVYYTILCPSVDLINEDNSSWVFVFIMATLFVVPIYMIYIFEVVYDKKAIDYALLLNSVVFISMYYSINNNGFENYDGFAKYIYANSMLCLMIISGFFLFKHLYKSNTTEINALFKDYYKLDIESEKLDFSIYNYLLYSPLNINDEYIFSKGESKSKNEKLIQMIPIFIEKNCSVMYCTNVKTNKSENEESKPTDNNIILIPKEYFVNENTINICILDKEGYRHTYKLKLKYNETHYINIIYYNKSLTKKNKTKKKTAFLKTSYITSVNTEYKNKCQIAMYKNLILSNEDSITIGGIARLNQDFGRGKTTQIKLLCNNNYSNTSHIISIPLIGKYPNQTLIEYVYFNMFKMVKEHKFNLMPSLTINISFIAFIMVFLPKNAIRPSVMLTIIVLITYLYSYFNLSDIFISRFIHNDFIKARYFQKKIDKLTKKNQFYIVFEDLDRETNSQKLGAIVTDLYDWYRSFHYRKKNNKIVLTTLINYDKSNIEKLTSPEQYEILENTLSKIVDRNIEKNAISKILNDYSKDLLNSGKSLFTEYDLIYDKVSLRDIKKAYTKEYDKTSDVN